MLRFEQGKNVCDREGPDSKAGWFQVTSLCLLAASNKSSNSTDRTFL